MVRGLVRACHPLPTLAVTACVSLLGWRLGWQGMQLLLLVAAVIVGQLSIGWSNDAHDAAADRALHRMDKPVVDGSVTAQQLWGFALVAAMLCVPLTLLAAGPVAGSFHLAAVAMAWVYNLRLSRTRWSWLPYLVAFGCLPYFLCLGSPLGAVPPMWFVIAAASLGVGAHLANAGVDLMRDSAGAAVSLGARGTVLVALPALVLASLAVVLAISAAQPALAVLGGAGAVLLTVFAGRQCWRTQWRSGFRLVMALAG
ncbi:MAG: UbiA family prenyltransferase, partial [Actinomycetales bacterium]